MSRMHQLMLEAARNHPERTEYDRAVAKGLDPERAARLLASQPLLVLHDGRTVWRLQNNPQRLEAHAAAVAKCPGFTGKKPPRPHATKGPGAMYSHRELGFRLFISQDMIGPGESELVLGTVVLTLNHRSRTIKGAVPPSWLVDLNAGPCEPEFEEELCGVEDLI